MIYDYFKPKYGAVRSFQLDLQVFTEYERNRMYSVVGAYEAIPEGGTVDAIMQMFLDTRKDNYTSTNDYLQTYQKTYVIENQEKDFGTIELEGALTDGQLENLKNFLMVENRIFTAKYQDYKAQNVFTIPNYFSCLVVLSSIEYREINNTNRYTVSIVLKKLTNWSTYKEYLTIGGWKWHFLGRNAYNYTYNMRYGVDIGDLTTIQFDSIVNEGNETAPYILEILENSSNLEFWIVNDKNETIGKLKVFGTYPALKIVSQDITINQEITKQGIYYKNSNGDWVETFNYDYNFENFFNLGLGNNYLTIKGITSISEADKRISVNMYVFEQYRIVGA